MRGRGARFLGALAVLQQRPGDSPSGMAPRRRLNPRIAARVLWKRIEAVLGLKAFVQAYRAARVAYVAGEADVVFPASTF